MKTMGTRDEDSGSWSGRCERLLGDGQINEGSKTATTSKMDEIQKTW